MKCPKCEKGEIQTIEFIRNGMRAHVCDECGALWLKDEEISPFNGHFLQSYAQANDYTYRVKVLNKKDQDHQALKPNEDEINGKGGE